MKTAATPPPPYYAVIFTALPSDDMEGYDIMAEMMVSLAQKQTGFLGIESVEDGMEITVSYWSSLEAIGIWKNNAEHLIAQKFGKEKWYSAYKVRVSKVEYDYGFGI